MNEYYFERCSLENLPEIERLAKSLILAPYKDDDKAMVWRGDAPNYVDSQGITYITFFKTAMNGDSPLVLETVDWVNQRNKDLQRIIEEIFRITGSDEFKAVEITHPFA